MTIKNVQIEQGSIRPVNLVARLFEGRANVTVNNGNGHENRQIDFIVQFNHEYDPIAGQFKPKTYPTTGQPWGYKKDPFESPVVRVQTMSYNGDLSTKVKEYFDRQFKEQYQ